MGSHLARLAAGRRNRPHSSLLDLLRSSSSLWVIVSHSYFYALIWLQFEPNTTRTLYKSGPEQFLPGATFAVDSFLLLSALLAKHEQRFHKAATLSQLLGQLLARYLRLVPVMIILIGLSLVILPNTCSPNECPNLARASVMFVDWCQSHWWLNMLLVHNFVATERMCLSHSWFVAVEFQLFALLSCATWLMARLRSEGSPISITRRSLLVGIVLVQCINSYIIYEYDLPPMPLMAGSGNSTGDGAELQRQISKENQFYKLLYIKPHHWLSSYLIGVALAGGSASLRKLARGWPHSRRCLAALLNAATLLALVLAMWPFRSNALTMNKQLASLYTLLARPLWSLSVASLLVLSPTIEPLSAAIAYLKRPTLHLSRLTYSAYLLHPILMAAFYGTRNELFQFSHSLMLYFTLGHLVLSHLLGLVVYLLIELPVQTKLGEMFALTSRQCNKTTAMRISMAPTTRTLRRPSRGASI